MMMYRMVNERYGDDGGMIDTKENWKRSIEATCLDLDWPIPEWKLIGDGKIIDNTTGETILEPVEDGWEEA